MWRAPVGQRQCDAGRQLVLDVLVSECFGAFKCLPGFRRSNRGRPAGRSAPAAGRLWTVACAAASCRGASAWSWTAFSSRSSGDQHRLRLRPVKTGRIKAVSTLTSMGCVSFKWALRSISSWGIQVGTSYGLERIQALRPRTPAWRRTRSKAAKQFRKIRSD